VKIANVELFPIQAECTHPGPIQPDIRPHVVVKLTTDAGLAGWGEITGYPPRPQPAARSDDLTRFLADLLVGQDPRRLSLIHDALSSRLAGATRGNQIACGVDLALHDLIGKSLGVPVVTLLGGAYRTEIPVAYPIPAHTRLDDVPASVAYIGEMLERGFSLIRFYIGLNLEADALCLRLMREQYGDKVTIKTLDCNGHLDWKTARAAIHRFQEYGFLLVESPARRGDHAGLAEVRRGIEAPVSEHAYTLTDAMSLARANAVDIFNITTVGAGGILPARKIAAVAEAAGISCLLGAAHELSLGTAGQAHLGLSLANLGYPVDCIGPEIYASDVVRTPLPYRNGQLTVPDQPGLGLDVDERKLAEHMTAATGLA
jgi:muconate cycloisomerase